MDRSNGNSTQVAGCLVRIFWMVFGNLILVLTAIAIIQTQAGFALTFRDAIFAATAVFMPAVRYVDICFLHGKTSDGQSATLSDWNRYAATVLGASLALWLLAHVIS
jgi:hypothetical protein